MPKTLRIVVKKDSKQWFMRQPGWTDWLPEKFFKKVIHPLRVKTGCSAQQIYKILQWCEAISVAIIIGFSTSILSRVLVLIWVMFLLWMGHAFWKKYLPLSTVPSASIPVSLIKDMLKQIDNRKNVYYINVFLLVLFHFQFAGWWSVWLIGITLIDIFKLTALTSGGIQTKLAKEKKPSIIAILQKALLPGSA